MERVKEVTVLMKLISVSRPFHPAGFFLSVSSHLLLKATVDLTVIYICTFGGHFYSKQLSSETGSYPSVQLRAWDLNA